MGIGLFQKLAVTLLVGAKPCVANNKYTIDWSDWPEQPTNPTPASNSSSETVSNPTLSARFGVSGTLRDMVKECSQRLDLSGTIKCDPYGNFQIPYMESGDLACGFQTRMMNTTFDNLATRYAFHFVGDSTTRRLAESFVAISTGIAPYREQYHEGRNLSVRGLQVNFHWAPYCSGDTPGRTAWGPDLRVGIQEVLHHQQQNRRDGVNRRTVIVTAFGVWDGVHGAANEAGLSACSDITTELTKVAQCSSTADETDEENDASPAIVVLLQNNPFLTGSKEDFFLNDLHRVQRQIVQNCEGGLFLAHDRDSIFERMSCLRVNDSIHFKDPVKLVEGKMLWDLIALIAGGEI